jgi:predicted nucleotide-binding protein
MNELSELRLHVLAIATAVEQNRRFFAAINHYVDRFKEIVTRPTPDLSQSELQLLARKIEEFYGQWRPKGDGFYIPPRETADTDSTVHEINQLVGRLANLSEDDFKALLPKSPAPESYDSDAEPGTKHAPCVFIGHGRSKLWARLKVFLQDELGAATVTYESESRTGESIVPILEKMLKQATFAVLVLTAEDETADGSRRARQNVVHEAGLFQGKLGFKKAILLLQEGIEEFSNVAGLQYIPFTDDKIEQSFYELQRVLKREKQIT